MFDTKQIEAFFDKHSKNFNKIPMIHVAGTNGKGSTCKMLSNILSLKYKVGLYTSPYDDWRFDNIQINGKTILKQEADTIINRFQADFETFKLSPFEIETIVALTFFTDSQVDLMIIEVGLGGSDDATNIITPKLSIITNIGTDHQDVLGQGIISIAKKKAGIIKKNIPVLIGHDIDKDAFDVIKHIANIHNATLYRSDVIIPLHTKPNITFLYQHHIMTLDNQANYQIRNASVVIKALEILDKMSIRINITDIQKGLAQPLLQKRFEIISNHPRIIIDGAHNKEGMMALVSTLKEKGIDDVYVIMSVLKDKPYEAMIASLQEVSSQIVFTTFEHERAMDLNVLKNKEIIIVDDMKNAINEILNDKDKTYVITGSLYFLTQAKAYLKEILA